MWKYAAVHRPQGRYIGCNTCRGTEDNEEVGADKERRGAGDIRIGIGQGRGRGGERGEASGGYKRYRGRVGRSYGVITGDGGGWRWVYR